MWEASLPAADSAGCWAAIDDLAHRMRGDDPTRTLEQCRADALVDLMLGGVQVATTVTLMIPVQSRQQNSLAVPDDFGQSVADPKPLVEPSWAQICAMGMRSPASGSSAGTWSPGSWRSSTPVSPGSCWTSAPGWSSRPASRSTCPTRRCAASSTNATAPAASRAAPGPPNAASSTTSFPTAAGDRPRSGTWSACANTTTGSNTTPAGHARSATARRCRALLRPTQIVTCRQLTGPMPTP